MKQFSINEIEQKVVDSGVNIAHISIHFLLGITGIAVSYRAGVVSILIEETLEEIDGVLSGLFH